MRDQRQGWQAREFGTAHEGRVGVVLVDGSTPRPVIFDIGSGTNFYESTDWRYHDGSWEYLVKAPRADALRTVCSCGWQGEAHPVATMPELVAELDGAAADAENESDAKDRHPWRALEDPAVCERDWAAHIAEVEHAAMQLPEDVARLLRQVGDRLDVLALDAPLAALRAVRLLHTTVGEAGANAATSARYDHDEATIGRALGLPEKETTACLYEYTRR
ncbi:hypothetical protein [Streptomyces sp. SID3343]|uniref:hypothetical protein n=1 Tax=Streptomyces sp. SID3343 TaxID=2690260 RepID=UPI00136F8648|nr:hypothetical protein [Streptomyces sp. SID3343]MYW01165.1 hypothetical protein [Streptomyces sp. SID3343]MYW04155.1 hypothetical protein [Streptomyces sp. SID3343]